MVERYSPAFIRCFLSLALGLAEVFATAQDGPCLLDYELEISPQPVDGAYACGQQVTFCITVTEWDQINMNWLHGMVPEFGPGWDLSTLTPGAAPATCDIDSDGAWAWYASVNGTSPTAIGPVGPGIFFNETPGNNPGNNFGDDCGGGVNWEFCFSISVVSGAACVGGTDLSVTFNFYGDSETGSWDEEGCLDDEDPVAPAVISPCTLNAGGPGNVAVCSTGAAVSLFASLTGTPDATGTWTGPGGAVHGALYDPAVDGPGVYIYRVTAPPPCVAAQATVTVVENPAVTAGPDGVLDVCSTGAAVALPVPAGATPGGNWRAPDGTAHGPNYNPANDAPGDFVYRVASIAPCPNDQATITVHEFTAANAGANGNAAFCGTSAAAALASYLGGTPDAGGNWTGPSGPHNAMYDPAIDGPGVYTYTVNGTAPCPNVQATVTIVENAPVNAGADGSLGVCASAGATALPLAPGSTPGGTWTAPGGATHGANYDPAVDGPGNYTYTVLGTTPCPNDQAVVTVSETAIPNAGVDVGTTLCATGALTDLSIILTGEDAGGNWVAPNGTALASPIIDPATAAAGQYRYIIPAAAPCPGDDATVTVTINEPPDAGPDADLDICAQGAATNLAALLPTAGLGGTWTGPGGASHGPLYDPATDAPGNYTYTVLGTTPCPNDQAVVTVSETAIPNAGADVGTTLCANGALTDLSIILTGEDAGGNWVAPNGTALASPIIDPATAAAGQYRYIIPAAAPCPGDDATVTVTINEPPDAGPDADLDICAQGAATSLAALLPTAGIGGTWTGPGGASHGPLYDPATDAPGNYTYTLTGTTPCPNDQAVVTVSETAIPNAGVDVGTTLCATGALTDLSIILTGEDAGGNWVAPNGTALASPIIDPATAAAGQYRYIIPAAAPCPGDDATVTVTINEPPDAGPDADLDICAQGAATSLAALLPTAGIGGTWTGPGGASHGPLYDPATDAPGNYTYTLTGTTPCPNDQAVVTVSETAIPNAGADVGTTLCANGALTDLSVVLTGEDAGGNWIAPDGTALASPIIDPATAAAGQYRYIIPASAPCPGDDAIVTVSIQAPPSAGDDGAVTICAQGAPQALFDALSNADPGGIWTAPGGGPHTGLYDPTLHVPGNYVYTVNGIMPCAADPAIVHVDETTTPNAGTDAAWVACTSDATVDLFQLLGVANPGGTWTTPDGGMHTGLLDPGSDAEGIYTYAVPAAEPCLADQAQVTVALRTPPDAGADGALTLCAQGAPADLNARLTPGTSLAGSWTDPSGIPHAPFFDPATDTPGDYTYTMNGSAPCSADVAIISVDLSATPNAGGDAVIVLCTSDAPIDLYTLLVTPDGGGDWTDPNSVSLGSSTIDPATAISGEYTYTIPALMPCPGDEAHVTVTINVPPDAGADGALTLCAQGVPTDLNARLTPGTSLAGSWTDPSGTTHAPLFDPATDTPGNYTYTLNGSAPCPADVAIITIDLSATPNAGGDAVIVLCTTDAPIDLYTLLIAPDGGGAWTDPNGVSLLSSTIDPATAISGEYMYTIPAFMPCPGDDARVTVTINAPPDAGADGELTLCAQGGNVGLSLALSGADEGGIWTDPDGGPHSVMYDPSLDGPGPYAYTVPGTSPCPASVAVITVSEVDTPDPGGDAGVVLCVSSAPIDLFSVLQGTPDGGGQWTAPDGAVHAASLDPSSDPSGVYTYTLIGLDPCPSAASRVTVTIHALPDAGDDRAVSLCQSAAPVALIDLLNGTPAANGSWTAPGGGMFGGVLDPATDATGAYTYTVAGSAPCSDAFASVMITVVAEPDAGVDGVVALCTNNAPIDLLDHLGTPDAGGYWIDAAGTAVPSLFDPATTATGVLRYIVAADMPCINDTARVTVTVNLLPTDGLLVPITLCATAASFDPFTVFNGAARSGGTWSAPNGVAFSGPIDPAVAADGAYVYTLIGQAPCPTGHNTLLLTVDDPFDAGENGTLTLCASGPITPLFPALTGSPDTNGSWSGPDQAPSGGSIDPAVALAGIYTYTVPAQGTCPSEQAAVAVTINRPPDAGADALITLCENDAPADPLIWLAGEPDGNGTWFAPDGSAFVPPFLPSLSAPGTYTYVVPGLFPCPAAQATVQIGIDQLPDPGQDASAAVCPEAMPFELFPLLGSPVTSGGIWTGPQGETVDGLFLPASMPDGTYTYQLEGTGACAGNIFRTVVEVTVWGSPSPVFTPATAIGCRPLTVTFALTDGSIATAEWTFSDGGHAQGVPLAPHTFTEAGSYSVAVDVVDTNGCIAGLAVEDLVFVQPDPNALFTANPDPTSTNKPDVYFTPDITGYASYAWSIDGEGAGTGAPWSFAFPDVLGGEYVVCLTVTDSIGCTASYCDPVKVHEALNLHVPNAFTPDGDGVNDGFAPVLVGADESNYSFYVFDRWGLIVFESHTVGEQWNGGMRNTGPELPEDVYVWKLLVGDAFSTDRKELLGHVTLLK